MTDLIFKESLFVLLQMLSLILLLYHSIRIVYPLILKHKSTDCLELPFQCHAHQKERISIGQSRLSVLFVLYRVWSHSLYAYSFNSKSSAQNVSSKQYKNIFFLSLHCKIPIQAQYQIGTLALLKQVLFIIMQSYEFFPFHF